MFGLYHRGSQNFDWRALSHIHELGIRAEDSGIAATLESIFETDWAQGVTVGTNRSMGVISHKGGTHDSPATVLASPVAANPSGVGYTLQSLVKMIQSANQSVRIQVMEYKLRPASKVGRWTAQMFLIFALQRPNVMPLADLGIRNAVRKAYGLLELPTAAELAEIAQKWHPYCSIATWYLWRSLDGAAQM